MSERLINSTSLRVILEIIRREITVMRILYITHFFPPTHNAGTENYTFGLAQAFLRQGHEVHVLCAEGWDVGDRYWNGNSVDEYKGVHVHRIHLNWIKANNPNKVLYDSREVEIWLDKFLKDQDFDLVHVTSTITLGVGILRIVKRLGIPLILTLMDFWFVCPSVQLLRSDESLCDGQTTAWQCQSCLLVNSIYLKKLGISSIPNSTHSSILGTLLRVNLISKRRGLRGMSLKYEGAQTIIDFCIISSRRNSHSFENCTKTS